jgi:tetratricopeptide (TPR) repeat protein
MGIGQVGILSGEHHGEHSPSYGLESRRSCRQATVFRQPRTGAYDRYRRSERLCLQVAYRFTPFDTDKLDSKIDSEKMYENLMNKFKFGGIDKPGIYIDENVMRMCYTHRRIFTQLVGQLIKEGKKDKALAALDYAEKMIPAINVPYDWANGAFQMAESYYQLGQNEKANKIIDELANKSLEYMIWYLSLNDNQLAIASENFVYNASLLDAEVRLMEKYKSEELAKHYSTQLDQLYNEYVTRMKGK